MSNTVELPNVEKLAPTAEQTLPAAVDDTVNEYADAEKNFQPRTLKFWTIVIGMYLSLFLVLLVSNSA